MAINNDQTHSLAQLLHALRQLQPVFVEGISEYALITRLQAPPYALFHADALRDPLTLFQCHFMLFHALHQLQEEWFSEGKGVLQIHAMGIKFAPITGNKKGLSTDDPLRKYYLNWQHFCNTEVDDVTLLIDAFWQRMGHGGVAYSSEDKRKAQVLLGYEDANTITQQQLKKRYRHLQHRCHPDKGGENSHSAQLAWAYQVLLTVT
ncbi:DNA-J related domain-containing protein [Alteromonas sp. C1M14]|uniref:DNA-J related domain-containing protein n=1 Tax=Alteromonas sp. C1M14 TaxID=2841567 RepID=UPI001C09BB78|nr:DNA-J related domain-containing protein [Alteromonas sp. C1M14]MBU2980004.1 molecular chaperone DnaJ [Alteromonas sp. C1M14]